MLRRCSGLAVSASSTKVSRRRYVDFETLTTTIERASAAPLLARIRIPTLIIHSFDDPFLPYEPFVQEEVQQNPHLLLSLTCKGGHVGFLEKDRQQDIDRLWAENRMIDYVRFALSREPFPGGVGLAPPPECWGQKWDESDVRRKHSLHGRLEGNRTRPLTGPGSLGIQKLVDIRVQHRRRRRKGDPDKESERDQ